LAIVDVIATGEAGFVKPCCHADLLPGCRPPSAPALVAPVRDHRRVDPAVTLVWARPADAEGLTYKVYLWPIHEGPEEKHSFPLVDADLSAKAQVITKSTPALTTGKYHYWKLVVQDRTGAPQKWLAGIAMPVSQ
jgi:hypothetical protein